MKGLLAGRLTSQDQLAAADNRRNYPMYQGEEWEKNQAFVAQLREVADECGKSVAQLVISWTVHQPGITAALCGGKRAVQVKENAGGVGWQLSDAQRTHIDQAIANRGVVVGRSPV